MVFLKPLSLFAGSRTGSMMMSTVVFVITVLLSSLMLPSTTSSSIVVVDVDGCNGGLGPRHLSTHRSFPLPKTSSSTTTTATTTTTTTKKSTSLSSQLLLLNVITRVLRGGDDESGNDDEELSSSSSSSTYTLGVRDSIMIAHSFHNHPKFGPAGGLHGATYTVDVEFISPKLEPDVNWVIDIGLASEILSDCLRRYNYQNLDNVFPPAKTADDNNGIIKPTMTTTEFMCRQIHDDLWKSLMMKAKHNSEVEGVDNEQQQQQHFHGRIRVKLWESHKAWASYIGPTMSTTTTTTTTTTE
jgi:6-pyruvoyl-tetrahydropterin synthase